MNSSSSSVFARWRLQTSTCLSGLLNSHSQNLPLRGIVVGAPLCSYACRALRTGSAGRGGRETPGDLGMAETPTVRPGQFDWSASRKTLTGKEEY